MGFDESPPSWKMKQRNWDLSVGRKSKTIIWHTVSTEYFIITDFFLYSHLVQTHQIRRLVSKRVLDYKLYSWIPPIKDKIFLKTLRARVCLLHFHQALRARVYLLYLHLGDRALMEYCKFWYTHVMLWRIYAPYPPLNVLTIKNIKSYYIKNGELRGTKCNKRYAMSEKERKKTEWL